MGVMGRATSFSEGGEEVDLAEPGVSTRELVDRIWAEVAAEQASQLETSLEPLPAFDQLLHDEERRYINAHCVFSRTPSDVTTGGGMRTLKRRTKARAGHFVMKVLERYFDEDQEFRAHLVRLLNTLTVEHDRLSAEVRETHEALRCEVDRLRQAYAAMHSAMEDRVRALEKRESPADDLQGARD
jgi:hypothetical protein